MIAFAVSGGFLEDLWEAVSQLTLLYLENAIKLIA